MVQVQTLFNINKQDGKLKDYGLGNNIYKRNISRIKKM